VAEVDYHDLWQRSRLSMAVVRRDARAVEDTLAAAERYLSAQEYDLGPVIRAVLSVEGDL
jgi:uncharacterized protein YlxP (DUF503 family)